MAATSHRLLEQAKIANAQIGFSTVFNNALRKTIDDPTMELGMRIPTTNRQEDFKFLGDIPQLREWVDDRPMAKLRTESISVVARPYSTGIRVDANDILDDRLNVVEPRIRMLASRARQHVAKSMVELLLNGFVAAPFPRISDGLAYDGANFFSAAHINGSGPTQSNLETAALTATSYEAGRVAMQSLKDEESEPLEIRPNFLLVGPSLEKTALEIVQSSFSEQSGAAVDNVLQGTATVSVSQRLTGSFANFWFLADLSQPVRPLIWTDREAPRFDALMDMRSQAAFDRNEFQFGTSYRAGYGYGLWEFVRGSNGTT